jgi:hypothetical protein
MKVGIAIATTALGLAAATTALAQGAERETYLRAPVRAPRQATEIGINTGYTQGFGNISPGEGGKVGRVADAGVGVGLSLGYRASPMIGLGWHGEFQEFNADDRLSEGTNVRGVATSVEASLHIAPYDRLDPYVSLGAGYRLLWEVPDGPNNNVLRHGIEVAKLQAGFDVRVSPDIALGPYVGADLNVFLFEDPEGPGGTSDIDDPRVSTFIGAGVQGRFDLGGFRESRPGTELGRR